MIVYGLVSALRHAGGVLCHFNQMGQGVSGIGQKGAALRQQFALHRRVHSRLPYGQHSIRQASGVFDHRRDDLLAGHVDHGAGLNVNRFRVAFIFDLHPGFQLRPGEYPELAEQLHRLFRNQVGDGVHHGGDIGKASAGRFLHPLGSVAVSVEHDPLMFGEILLDQVVNILLKILSLLQLIAGLTEGLRHDGVQHNVGRGDGISGSHHTELEFVSGKGKGGGAVPVCGVLGKIRQGAHTGLEHASRLAPGGGSRGDQLGNHVLQLFSQKYGDNGRGRLVGSQTVVISRISRRLPQQFRMLVHRFQNAGQHQQKLDILMGRFARIQHVDAVIRNDGPVVVLAGTVDPGKGLFVKQALHAVLGGHPFQGLHDNLVVVHRHIGHRVDGSQLVLGRRHLVVLGLGGHAQLPQLQVHIPHKGSHSLADGAEIVIVQLLPLGRHGAKKGTAGIDQVFSLLEYLGVHQEILLLRSHGGSHFSGCGIPEQAQQTQRLGIDGLHGAQQGRLKVQGLSRVGAERRGNTQDRSRRVLSHKGRGRAVPGRIASGLKGGPQSAGGKRRSVRFSLDQLFAGKLHQDRAVRSGSGDKRIMLLRRHACQGLEPVGIVGGALLDGPLLHGLRHCLRHNGIQLFALIYGLMKLFINLLRQPLLHHLVAEYVFTENIRYVKVFSHTFPSFPCFYKKRAFQQTVCGMPFPFQSVSTLHLFFLNCKSFLLFHDISQTENFQKSAKPETFTKPSLLSHVQVDVLFQMKPTVNDSLIHIFRRHRHRLDAVVGNVLGPVINGIRHPQLGAGSGNILSLS